MRIWSRKSQKTGFSPRKNDELMAFLEEMLAEFKGGNPLQACAQRITNDAAEGNFYGTLSLTQGSEEWLTWRNQSSGASDAPVIMGENPGRKRIRR